MDSRRFLILGGLAAFISSAVNAAPAKKKRKKKSQSAGGARNFRSCAAARRAGYTNMRSGQPGYSRNLDRDGDGLACDK